MLHCATGSEILFTWDFTDSPRRIPEASQRVLDHCSYSVSAGSPRASPSREPPVERQMTKFKNLFRDWDLGGFGKDHEAC